MTSFAGKTLGRLRNGSDRMGDGRVDAGGFCAFVRGRAGDQLEARGCGEEEDLLGGGGGGAELVSRDQVFLFFEGVGK